MVVSFLRAPCQSLFGKPYNSSRFGKAPHKFCVLGTPHTSVCMYLSSILKKICECLFLRHSLSAVATTSEF